MARPKTAWVIGSGFSKALGGPLLDGLLSKSAYEDTKEIFRGLPERAAVYDIFASKLKVRWEHAEQFLEFVDLATDAKKPNFNLLKEMLASCSVVGAAELTPETFRDLTTLSIASEVSTYTDNVDLRAEAWAPYIRWGSGRRGNDSLITFNYDTVLECLGNAKEVPVRHLGQATVFHPVGANAFSDDDCIIYKLHGSADWAWDDHGRERFQVFGSVGGFTLQDGYRPLIAMPGATKKKLCAEHLDYIWKSALTKLREAEVIVFLGYRFPPSDSFARTALLAAIQQNEAEYLRIHTVLGPSIHGEASLRLHALLTAILEAKGRSRHEVDSHRPGAALADRALYSVIQQPLYVEDFLSVLSMDMLYGKRVGSGTIPWDAD